MWFPDGERWVTGCVKRCLTVVNVSPHTLSRLDVVRPLVSIIACRTSKTSEVEYGHEEHQASFEAASGVVFSLGRGYGIRAALTGRGGCGRGAGGRRRGAGAEHGSVFWQRAGHDGGGGAAGDGDDHGQRARRDADGDEQRVRRVCADAVSVALKSGLAGLRWGVLADGDGADVPAGGDYGDQGGCGRQREGAGAVELRGGERHGDGGGYERVRDRCEVCDAGDADRPEAD